MLRRILSKELMDILMEIEVMEVEELLQPAGSRGGAQSPPHERPGVYSQCEPTCVTSVNPPV
jgi:hypothetical protein